MKTHFHLSCSFHSEQVSVNITCNIWDFDESFSQHECSYLNFSRQIWSCGRQLMNWEWTTQNRKLISFERTSKLTDFRISDLLLDCSTFIWKFIKTKTVRSRDYYEKISGTMRYLTEKCRERVKSGVEMGGKDLKSVRQNRKWDELVEMKQKEVPEKNQRKLTGVKWLLLRLDKIAPSPSALIGSVSLCQHQGEPSASCLGMWVEACLTFHLCLIASCLSVSFCVWMFVKKALPFVQTNYRRPHLALDFLIA